MARFGLKQVDPAIKPVGGYGVPYVIHVSLIHQVQASDGFCTQNFPPVISMQVPVMNDA